MGTYPIRPLQLHTTLSHPRFAACNGAGYRSWWAFHRRQVESLWLVTLHNDAVHTSRQAAEKLASVLPMTLDKAIIFVQGKTPSSVDARAPPILPSLSSLALTQHQVRTTRRTRVSSRTQRRSQFV